jgi:DNA-binding transcriptional MerR regulator
VHGQALDLAPGCKVYRQVVRISELAENVGVPTSTVRYYERVGLMGAPHRTSSGYRDYDSADAARLLFVSRARRMGLSCEQITGLLPLWAGTDCAAAQDRVGQLIDEKQAEIVDQIRQLELFAAQLEAVREVVSATAPPAACRADLSCCVPETGPTAVELVARTPRRD